MANDFSALIKTILDTSGIQGDVSKLEKELSKKKINLQTVIDISSNKKLLQEYALQIQAIFKNQGIDIDISKITSSLNQVFKQVEATTSKLNNIQISIDTEKYSTEIFKLQRQLSSFGTESGEVFTKATISLQQLESAYESMKTTNGDERLRYEKEYQTALATTKNLLSQITSTKENELIVSGDSRRTKFIADLNNYLLKNTAMTSQNRQVIIEWIAILDSADDITRGTFNNIRTEFTKLDATLRSSNQLGLSWTDKFKQAWEKFGGWSIATGTLMTAYTQLRKIPEAIYEIDTAMTELYKVTDETDTRYTKFLTNACDNAKELGRNVSSLIEQTATWAKLGFSIDEAEELAKISSIYANVGEVDDDTAVSDLVTAMKSFNIAASDSITIVNSLNKLGNEFATDAASLGEGLKNSASALSVAGNDINQTLAMLTGGGEITQDVGNLGNALKVVSLRLRGKLLCLHTRKVRMLCYA